MRLPAFKDISRWTDKLVSVGMVIAGILVIVMMLLITTEVILRKLWGLSTLVAQEYSGYMLVAITFLVTGYSLRSGAFIRVTALYERLPRLVREVVQLGYDLLGVLYVSLLGYYCYVLAWNSYVQGAVSTQVSHTPLYVPQLTMAIGCTFLLLALAREVGAGLRAIYSNVPRREP